MEKLLLSESPLIFSKKEEKDFTFLSKIASQLSECEIAIIQIFDTFHQKITSFHTGIKNSTNLKFDNSTEFSILNNQKIIFNLKIPLINENGNQVGTLHLIDFEEKDIDIELIQNISSQILYLITLKLANHDFENKNHQLKNVFENSLDLLAIVDNNGKFISINSQWEKILGYSFEDLKTKNFFTFLDSTNTHKNFNLIEFNTSFINHFESKNDNYKSFEWYCYSKEENLFFINLREITQQLKTEKKLAEITTLLNDAQNISKIGAWELNLSTGETIWTDEVYKIHEVDNNFDHNKVNGIEFYHPQDQAIIIKAIENTINTHEEFDVICRFITAKGNHRFVRSLGRMVLENNKPSKLIGVFQDITEEKNNELLLENSKQKIQNIIEGTNIGTWEWNIQTGETIFNERWAEIIGYTLDELQPIDVNTWVKLINPDDFIKSQEKLIECFEKRSNFYENEYRILHKNGHWVWVYDRGKIFTWTDEGKPLLMFGTHEDISEKKNAEKQIIDSLTKLQNVLNASTDVSIIGGDLNGLIHTFNKGAENLLGYTAEEMIHQKKPFVFHLMSEVEERGKSLSEQYQRNIEGFDVFITPPKNSTTISQEWTYIHKNGTHFPVLLTVTPIKSPENIVTGYLGVAVDISDIKKVENELNLILELSKKQNIRLKDFAYIVSHNLRNHSGNITALINLLIDEEPEMENHEIINTIKVASNNLWETIAHLEEVALINVTDSKNMDTINIYDIINTNIETLQSLAKKENITIINEIHSEEKVKGISAYVDSIILNMLSNACKYHSTKRSSFVKLFLTKSKNYLILHIEDNGLGIDLEKHGNKIFGMFKTFHDHSEARGIGLFIVKNQIEALGGFIEVESTPEVGTTFKIYFKI